MALLLAQHLGQVLESRCSWIRGKLCSRSRFGARDCHHGIKKQQLELVAQAHGSRDAVEILRCILAGRHKRIDGRNLLPHLLMGGKKGDLLGAHRVVAHQSWTDTSANLNEDVFAGTHRGDFLRDGAIS